jgi:hypothetical protein
VSASKLATADILAFLEEPLKAAPGAAAPTPDVDDMRGRYRAAAAVLAAIQSPSTLRPVGEVGGGGQAETVLADELIPATGRGFHGTVMLDPAVRLDTVRELVKTGGIEAALAANPDERVGSIQEQLERYLTGKAEPLDTQSLDQLDATAQIAAWIHGAVDGVPSEAEVQARGAYRRLLEPFEAIAGDDRFRGRVSELDELRSYIGVVPPASLIRRVHSAAFKWMEPERQPAMSISGPGGVGKSALVARFMLEHTRVEESARIPFAYLDFDRVALDVGDPFGLIVEMIRQLTVQYPGVDRFEAFQKYVNDPSSRPAIDASALLATAEGILADLLGRMRTVLGPRPYVVVLDTFEEVQYRGENRAYPLWEMLDRLQQRAPFLRVVISGRAPVTSLMLAGKQPRPLVLGELDTEAAVAFLKSQGVTDEDVATRLVKSFGGVPLSLKLVATLLAQDPDALKAANAPKGRGSWFVSISDEVIQGQLYERVLDRIRDDQVRRLAYPGLVLRRITPEVILEVLNEPCELGVQTMSEAATLFDGLRREVSLVAVDQTDGALVHRSDLRRVMLRLLVESDPIRVRKIREAAIDYYERLPGRRGLAEATYHRLALGQSVHETILRDPEVRRSIQTAISEFSIPVQLELSTLGFEVTDEVRSQASREQRDTAVASQVEDMLPYGLTSLASAKQLVEEASQGLAGPSPLYRAGARVAAQQDDLPLARTWISRGLEAAALANGGEWTLGLVREQAWFQQGLARSDDEVSLGQLATYAERYQDRLALAQHRLQALDPHGSPSTGALSTIRDLLRDLGPLGAWNLAPATRSAVELSVDLPDTGIVNVLHGLVLSESGPFRFVTFPDYAVHSALQEVLGSDPSPVRFGKSWLRLLEMWPYRVLDVRPPFGRQGEQLSESAA